MAILFKREGAIVIPTVEALMIYPFSEIWERDTETPQKHLALQEFAYIEFMTSQLNENPYRDYPADRKVKAIIQGVFRDNTDWTPDPLVREGIEYMKKMQSEGSDDYDFLMSSLRARDKMKDFLDEFDLNERANEGKGALLLKPKDITSALMDVERVTVSIMNTRKKVAEQVTESIKVKGQKEISPFANPESLKAIQ